MSNFRIAINLVGHRLLLGKVIPLLIASHFQNVMRCERFECFVLFVHVVPMNKLRTDINRDIF